MFGRKRRAEKEAAAKAKADADLKTAIVDLIGIAEGETPDPEGGPLVLKAGERLVYTMSDGGLFEPRRERGHWSGRSAGFSVPVTDGIRFRVGKSAGTYVQGQEKPTIIDTGDISFTTQRVVFQGGKYTREWQFSKLVGVVHDANQPCTAIQVSNREKTSGIVYAGGSPEIVRLKLEVAVAIFNGDGPDAARELREKLRELDTSTLPTASTAALPRGPQTAASSSGPSSNETPTSAGTATTSPPSVPGGPPPVPPPITTSGPSLGWSPPPVPPPMWAADPTGRHQLRYWDGASWTDYVSDNGHEFHEASPTTAG